MHPLSKVQVRNHRSIYNITASSQTSCVLTPSYISPSEPKPMDPQHLPYHFPFSAILSCETPAHVPPPSSSTTTLIFPLRKLQTRWWLDALEPTLISQPNSSYFPREPTIPATRLPYRATRSNSAAAVHRPRTFFRSPTHMAPYSPHAAPRCSQARLKMPNGRSMRRV